MREGDAGELPSERRIEQQRRGTPFRASNWTLGKHGFDALTVNDGRCAHLNRALVEILLSRKRSQSPRVRGSDRARDEEKESLSERLGATPQWHENLKEVCRCPDALFRRTELTLQTLL